MWSMNIHVFQLFLAFLHATGGYASGEEDYRQCVGDLNLTSKCPPYSLELSSQWMCLAQKKGCLDRFHCARDDKTHEFNMICADPVPCYAGQEPRINMKAQRVYCFYCYDKERYGQNFERQSNTLSQCEFEKSRPDYSVVREEFNDIRRYLQNYDYRCRYEDDYILENYQDYHSYYTNNSQGRCIFVGPCPPGQERIKDYSCVAKCAENMARYRRSKCIPKAPTYETDPNPGPIEPVTEKYVSSNTRTTASPFLKVTPGKSLDFDTKYTFVIVMIIAVVGVLLIWFRKKGEKPDTEDGSVREPLLVVTCFRKGKNNEAELENVRNMELDIEVGSEAEPLIDKLRYSHTDYVLKNDSTNKCQQENTGELKTDNTHSENDSLKIIDISSEDNRKPDTSHPTVEVFQEAHSDVLEPELGSIQDSRITSDQNKALTAESPNQKEELFQKYKELKQKRSGRIKENISTEVETNENGSPDEETYTSSDEEVNTGRVDLPPPVGIIEGCDKKDKHGEEDQNAGGNYHQSNRENKEERNDDIEERKDEERDPSEQFGPEKTVRLCSLNDIGTSVDVENKTEGRPENISTEVETNEDGSPDEETYTPADEEVNTGRVDFPPPVGIIGHDKEDKHGVEDQNAGGNYHQSNRENKEERNDDIEGTGDGNKSTENKRNGDKSSDAEPSSDDENQNTENEDLHPPVGKERHKKEDKHGLEDENTGGDTCQPNRDNDDKKEQRKDVLADTDDERKDEERDTAEQFGPEKTLSLRSLSEIGTSFGVENKTEGLKPEKKDKETDASEQLGPEKTVSLRSINVIGNSVEVGNRTEGLGPEVTKQENTDQEKEMRAKERLQILDTKKDFEAFHKAAKTISVEHSDLFEFMKRDNPNRMSPKNYKNVPEGFRSFESSGDNNSSLYQSISILLCGDESYQYRLRLAAVLQGVKNFKQYLKQIMMAIPGRDKLQCFCEAQVLDNIAEKCCNIQSDADMTEAFLKEIIMETASVGTNSGQIQAMFVCSALGTGLHQFYQTNDRFLVKERIVLIDDLSLDDSAPSEFLTIMWVNAEDNLKGGLTHVIPLFTNEELKRKGYDSEV